MRVRLITLAASLASVLAGSRAAHADPMDPAIERFAHDASDPTMACANAGLYRPGARPCTLDDAPLSKGSSTNMDSRLRRWRCLRPHHRIRRLAKWRAGRVHEHRQ
jgi:hypothetical protein